MKNNNHNSSANIFSRFFFLLGLLFLLPVFFTPLWQIHLAAPQYPEGLTMFIHYNTVTGESENDLENINLLNHYIGMKKIEPDSIPELVYMKYIIGGLIFLGLLIFFLKKKALILTWVVAISLIGIAGIYDLNRWEEDYGKDLNPKAPIKVEGMVYKPPLIGEKQLLNITATSYPQVGGFCFAFSIFITGMAAFMAYKRPTHEEENRDSSKGTGNVTNKAEPKIVKINFPGENSKVKVLFVAAVFSFTLNSCTIEPSPIQYGKDVCAHCMMLISDSRFGSEILTQKGKSYKFDSIECMIHFLASGKVEEKNIHSFLTTDYTKPGFLIDASAAHFLISPDLQSPMGANLVAFEQQSIRDEFYEKNTGKQLNWNQTLADIGR